MSNEKLIVLEVRGGMVQEVYTDVNDLRFVLVDWDNIDAGDSDDRDETAVEYEAIGLKRMPDETRHEVENALV